MNKTLVGIVVGLMIATSTVYFVETSEELFEDQNMVEGTFFLVAGIAHIPLIIWIVKKDSTLPILIILVGTVFLLALYGITRTDMLASFGMEAESIGHLGMTSKVIQIGIVISSVWLLFQARKLRPKLDKVNE